MKAAILNGYHQEVVIQDIPLPSIGDEDVLVKIKAAGVNPLDNMIIQGDVKLIVPYKFPLVMSNEFVGVIERIGSNVSKFSVGERVYGRMPLKRIGTFAEYAAIDMTSFSFVKTAQVWSVFQTSLLKSTLKPLSMKFFLCLT